MSSALDIANLALSNLGAQATVASIDPPEQSAEGGICAQFYPMARDAVLQAFPWSFSTGRARLAPLTVEWDQWQYCYAKPQDALSIRAVMASDATGDGQADRQPYTIETNSTGQEVILTNMADAICLYTKGNINTARFPPMVVIAMSWQLASMMAGPLIKGDAGAAEAKRCEAIASSWLSRAAANDANQRKVDLEFKPNWIEQR